MPKAHHTTARLEAFSDGVIAVIITIMVLELKVPVADGLAGFLTILPTLGLYLLSFTFTGIYWINHHQLVDRTDEAGHGILYANLFFLFWLSLLPFMTSYVMQKKIDPSSVALYDVLMILIGGSFLVLRLTIGRHLRQTGQLEAADAAAERKHWISLGLYLLSIALSFTHPVLALGIVGLVLILWVVPTAKLSPVEHCVDVHAARNDKRNSESATHQ